MKQYVMMSLMWLAAVEANKQADAKAPALS